MHEVNMVSFLVTTNGHRLPLDSALERAEQLPLSYHSATTEPARSYF